MQLEDLLDHQKVHSDIIRTPDGTEHIVAMPGWYWNTLDYLSAMDWAEPGTVVEIAWKGKKLNDAHGYPTSFVSALMFSIFEAYEQHRYYTEGHANDSAA